VCKDGSNTVFNLGLTFYNLRLGSRHIYFSSDRNISVKIRNSKAHNRHCLSQALTMVAAPPAATAAMTAAARIPGIRNNLS